MRRGEYGISFSPTAAAADITVLGFFTDPQLRVVSTCEDLPGPPLVVCHDSSSGRHSVWAVHPATSQVGCVRCEDWREEGGEEGEMLAVGWCIQYTKYLRPIELIKLVVSNM